MPVERLSFAVATLAAFVAAGTLQAQASGQPASSAKGLILGAHLNGSSLTIDDSEIENESGPGFSLQAGYGFTRNLALLVELTAAALTIDRETLGLGHFDIGGRYSFTSDTRRFVPFIDLAFSGRVLTADDVDLGGGPNRLTATGSGFTIGGGVQYHVAPKVAIGIALKWMTGEFSEVKFGDRTESGLEIDSESTRVNVGVTWYPRAGR